MYVVDNGVFMSTKVKTVLIILCVIICGVILSNLSLLFSSSNSGNNTNHEQTTSSEITSNSDTQSNQNNNVNDPGVNPVQNTDSSQTDVDVQNNSNTREQGPNYVVCYNALMRMTEYHRVITSDAAASYPPEILNVMYRNLNIDEAKQIVEKCVETQSYQMSNNPQFGTNFENSYAEVCGNDDGFCNNTSDNAK
jgi:hypothetical protein